MVLVLQMWVIVSPAADPDVIHKGGSSLANDARIHIKGVIQWCSEYLCQFQAGILKPNGIGL